MNLHPKDKLQPLFEVAVDLEPSKRALFLEHACAGDADLRRRLEALLAVDGRATRSILAQRGQAKDLPRQHERALSPILTLQPQTAPDGDSDTILTSGPVDWMSAQPPERRTPVATHTAIVPGTHVHHYEIIREIGRGGMGAVFLARDTKLGRRVAMKFLHTRDRGLVERFLLEARATARCSHENIVVIHDVNEHQNTPYMVLEYLKGTPLNKLVGDERIPPGRAVQLMVPVVRALVCAHERKIVHRDLKPANIFMADSGTIKVLDFGIAKVVFGDARRSTVQTKSVQPLTATVDIPLSGNEQLTRRGVLVGTLPYMSPEQWGASAIDHRTDIWAVGIMLYRMIVGRHPLAPLRGEQLVATAVLEQPMPSAHDSDVDMPLGLADIIDGCLQKHKDQRIASAAKLLSALEPYLPGRRPAELDTEQCPYTGLNAFQEADANRFFGRTHEIGTVLARLHSTALIGLVGPSGVGKSSLVRAGVIPALEQSGETWEAMVIRPGRHPMAALANLVVPIVSTESSRLSDHVAEHQSALQRLYREPGYLGTVLRGRARTRKGKLLLFVDQFEELFTMSPDSSERLAFTACLAGMADDPMSPLRLMLSIRSDFLDRVAEDRHFMAELSQNMIFVAAPSREGLRDAIVRPAEMARYRFESVVMVEHMLDTLQITPGCLPLLQFAAAKLWDARDRERRVLTEESYEQLGGVVGALATHADAVLASMPPRDQALVRTIFLQLVTPERTRAIKSIAELHEFADLPGQPEAVEQIVSQLVEARLLVVQRGKRSGGTVEIVHESLIRSWPTLAHWLDENQEDAVFLEQLRTAAKQWQARSRARDLLWRGETMHEARAWHRRYKGTLPAIQKDFLTASFINANRTRRIRRFVLVATMAFLGLLVAAAAVALVLIRDAERHANEQARDARAMRAEAERQADSALSAQKLAETKEFAARTAEDKAKESKQRALNLLAELENAKTDRNHALKIARSAKKMLDEERSNQREQSDSSGNTQTTDSNTTTTSSVSSPEKLSKPRTKPKNVPERGDDPL